MGSVVLDGREVSKKWREEIASLIRSRSLNPLLWVIFAGNNPASEIYVRNKVRAGESTGIRVEVKRPSSQEEILAFLENARTRDDVNGVIVQLPLPEGVDRNYVVESIPPDKDVDGLTSLNLGLLFKGMPRFIPCTPLGIMKLLEAYGIEVRGKRAVVIGRSELVGKPLAALLLNSDATVTVAHSKTENLPELVREAELVFVAVGKPHFLKKEWVREGAVVVDIGINKVGDNLVGDVSPEVFEVASYITPVPGGVGPMTVSALMYNTYLSALSKSS